MIRLFVLLMSVCATAFAQPYPERPIRIIVPFAAGDGLDLQMRLVGQRLTERWGQQVLVENRPGAGTLIGTEAAMKAPGDGYTILLVTTSFTINPSLHPKVPYDPLKDFAPLMQTTATPAVVAASPSLAANSLAELLAGAKQKPAYFTIGHAGNGTAGHIGIVLLESSAGVQLLHVPYKSIPGAILDLMSGQLQLLFTSPIQVLGPIREGRIKAIAVTSARRMPHIPGVQTVKEAGVEGYEVYGWVGLVVPAATPPDTVAKLNREIGAILTAPAVRTRLENEGSEVIASTPEQFGAYLRSELARWERVIRTAGIKPP